MAGLIVYTMTACPAKKKDDNSALGALLLGGSCPGGTIQGNISASTTFPNRSCISGAVFVQSGVTVTVNPGSTIYGLSGSSLFFLQGAKLNAVGTASQPIIFTSASTAGTRRPADWGGIVLIGNAKINVAAVRQTEGTTPQNYGGPTSNDDTSDSGRMSYVRIEFAGYQVTTGSELNCLSNYTVGNGGVGATGTVYDHIQCHYSADDSFEWWGGAVQAKYLLSTCADDENFDMDLGFHGKLQYLIGYGDCGFTSTEDAGRGMELNGVGQASEGFNSTPDGGATYANYSDPKISNFTIIGRGTNNRAVDEGIRFRRGMSGSFTCGLIDRYNLAVEANCSTDAAGAASNATLNFVIYNNAATLAPTNGSGCTYSNNTTTASNVITANPVISAGTAGNFVGAVGTTGCTGGARANQGGDTFFDTTTVLGGVDTTDWTAGWTTFAPN